MGIFIYSPTNSTAIKIRDFIDTSGFLFNNRSHMEMIILNHLKDIGLDIYPTAHCIIGSLAGSLDVHMALSDDIDIERTAKKHCHPNKAWSYVKLMNGPRMSFVIGYSDADAIQPYAYTKAQLVQKGITNSTFIPGMGD